jgi:dTDP-4-amino-4,6-dideoxygalactose transaminase
MNTLSVPAFPPPRVPTHPVLSFRSLFATSQAPAIRALSEIEPHKWFTSGRVALATALSLLRVQAGDGVLLPAYNCRAMVDAVRWTGAEPVLYKSKVDLAVDVDDVAAKIDARTRALVVVHFFGFPQRAMLRLRSFCDERGIALIEDCAHCFFGSLDGQPIGTFGDYAIASPMKFFPLYDGGFLASARHSLGAVKLRRGSFVFQIKALLNNVERSFAYSRLRPINWLMALPLYAKDRFWSFAKRLDAPFATDAHGPDASGDAYAFDAAWVDVEMSGISKALCSRISVPQLIERRRSHYAALLRAFENQHGCRPFFPDLPDGVVPYVFPLLVDDPERVFPRLKARGVPLFRWEDVRHDVCETSSVYSRSLFQLPCHQELSAREVDWVIAEVKRALES